MIGNRRFYTTLGVLAAAAALSLSMIAIPALAAGSYLSIDSWSVKQVPAPNQDKVSYKVTTEARIPPKADKYINSLPLTVLGYGWLDVNTSPITGVFATIHPAFTDSTFATGDKWHAHTGLVAPSTADSSRLCLVYLASPAFGLDLNKETLTQALASGDATVAPGTADAAVPFTLNLTTSDICPAIEVPVLSDSAGALSIEVLPLAP